MVELRILAGSRKDSVVPIRKAPFTIGRSPGSDLALADPGVWERHATLNRNLSNGYFVSSDGEAVVRVDGSSVKEQHLRNGSLIECGAAKLRFDLTAPVQRTNRWMEWLAT